jgi:hypothetical protein
VPHADVHRGAHEQERDDRRNHDQGDPERDLEAVGKGEQIEHGVMVATRPGGTGVPRDARTFGD